MIAALYVLKDGPYYNLPGVDPWPQERDARLYAGPWAVVAHPPCERWGRFATGGMQRAGAFRVGDDGGCFAAGLASVRRFGGILEHPQDSKAWSRFQLVAPPRSGGWIVADMHGGWTCRVEQGFYGHVSRKATWLYAVNCRLPDLRWGFGEQRLVQRPGLTYLQMRRKGVVHYMTKRQRAETPAEFRDLLISIAETANR